jgi:WD40 repeat protein
VTALSDGNRVLVSCGADNTVKVWKLPDGKLLYTLSDDEDVTWNLCLATYRLPLPAEEDSIHTQTQTQMHTGEAEEELSGPIVVVGCKNATLRIWKLPDALQGPLGDSRPSRVVRGHTSRVHAIVIYGFRNDVFMATACRDANIRVWSLAGELIRTLRSTDSAIQTLSAYDVSDEGGGAILACGLADGNLKLWKHSTGEVLRYFNGHTEEITALEIINTPADIEGLIVVSASKDRNVRTWLYAKEKSLRVMRHTKESHCSRVNSLVVFAEGDTVASKNRMFYALCYMLYAIRYTFYVLRFTFYVLRYTLYVIRYMFSPHTTHPNHP